MSFNHADFNTRAHQWDALPRRVALAHAVVATLCEEVVLDTDMQVLDFGCGTGLVTTDLIPHVKHVYGMDSSAGMLEQLAQKLTQEQTSSVTLMQVAPDEVPVVPCDLDVIVSSMTMHHIPDISPLFEVFTAALRPGGILAIADLAAEDGTFHDDATGIAHHGFSVETMEGYCRQAGLVDVRTVPVITIRKEREGKESDYLVQMTIARRP